MNLMHPFHLLNQQAAQIPMGVFCLPGYFAPGETLVSVVTLSPVND